LIEHCPSRLTDRAAWTRFPEAARVRSPEMIKKIQSEGRQDMEEALLRDPIEYDAVRRERGPSTLLGLVPCVPDYLFEGFKQDLMELGAVIVVKATTFRHYPWSLELVHPIGEERVTGIVRNL
jgi:hypothetical protein